MTVLNSSSPLRREKGERKSYIYIYKYKLLINTFLTKFLLFLRIRCQEGGSSDFWTVIVIVSGLTKEGIADTDS